MLPETDFLQCMEIINNAAKTKAAAVRANIYPFLFGLDSSWHLVCLSGKRFSCGTCTHRSCCVCFVYAQVSCVLTEVSFPSIFEESVLASFSLEATLRGVFLTPIFTLRLRALGLRAFLQMTAVRKQTGTVTVKY